MATTSGNERAQQRSIEPRRGETAGQDVTSRQGSHGQQGQQGQPGQGLRERGMSGISGSRGFAGGGLGRRGVGASAPISPG